MSNRYLIEDHREASALIREAIRRGPSMTTREAEALYVKLERAKRRLEGHADARSVRLSRQITDVLSYYVGPRHRGGPVQPAYLRRHKRLHGRHPR